MYIVALIKAVLRLCQSLETKYTVSAVFSNIIGKLLENGSNASLILGLFLSSNKIKKIQIIVLTDRFPIS